MIMRRDLLKEISTSHSRMVQHGITDRLQAVLMLRRVNGQKSNVIMYRVNLLKVIHSVL